MDVSSLDGEFSIPDMDEVEMPSIEDVNLPELDGELP